MKRDLLNEYLLPQGRNDPSRPGPHARELQPRHMVDTIIGDETPKKEVINLEVTSQAFQLSNTFISLTNKDYHI